MPSSGNPGDVKNPDGEDNKAAEESLPEPDPDQSSRRNKCPRFCHVLEDDVAQYVTVEAAAVDADIHDSEKNQ